MAAKKRFNVTGLCRPSLHYMVDISAKIDVIVRDYIELGEYFVINRARQYGKTTTLELLEERLCAKYLVLLLSFEGHEEYFESLRTLVLGISLQIRRLLLEIQPELSTIFSSEISDELPMDTLGERVSQLCRESEKPVILMIDEVDRASDYAVFASFLGLLRTKYLQRKSPSSRTTFHNVVLAGVHDIKNLKAKIRPDSGQAYNSPWNIAASFTVDMSFSANQIATMQNDYEADYITGMDIRAVAERLYFHTSGYPFLVSLLCKYIHEDELGWTSEGVDAAANRSLKAPNTLFDDMIKNLMNHPEFSRIVERIVLEGKRVAFNPDDPSINLGRMYGILTPKNDFMVIANQIFQSRLMNYFISVSATGALANDRAIQEISLYIKDGVLCLDKVLERFCEFMSDEYRNQDSAFIEREARRLLIGYIKPIINGRGQYFLEPEIRGGQRIDLLVQYGQVEYVIEVKIWRGQAYENAAYEQIAQYVKARHMRVGYVVSFCDQKKMRRKNDVFMHDDVEIHEYIVAYNDTVRLK